jgi:hypothetical protein
MRAKTVVGGLLLIGTFSVSAAKKAPPPNTSTVLLRLDRLGVNGCDLTETLELLNVETKTVSRWFMKAIKPHSNQRGCSLAVSGYAEPGRYLITRYIESYGGPGPFSGSFSREIRCEITVPTPDIAIFYGTITLPAVGDAQIEAATIDDTVRDFYERSVPFRRSDLIAGEMRPEPVFQILSSSAPAPGNTPPSPLYPKPHFGMLGGPITPTPVDSLRPVFKWQAQSPDRRVDFIIWEAVPVPTKGRQALFPILGQYVKGETIYHKEGIIGGEWQLEKDLAPDTPYYWSIRLTGTTSWATASHSFSIILASASYTGEFFMFKTPKR